MLLLKIRTALNHPLSLYYGNKRKTDRGYDLNIEIKIYDLKIVMNEFLFKVCLHRSLTIN